MLESGVRIVNQLGLHARAAAKLVKTAEKFDSKIIITNEESNVSVDAKSILNLLTLCASQGTELKIKTDGADEQKALNGVIEVIEHGFGEN